MKLFFTILSTLLLSCVAANGQTEKTLQVVAADRCLDYFIKYRNKTLPDTTNKIVCFESMERDGFNVTKNFVVADSNSFNQIRNKRELYKNEIIYSINEAVIKEDDFICSIVLDQGSVFEYRFYNDDRTDSLSIVFTSEELKGILPSFKTKSAVCEIFCFSDETEEAFIADSLITLRLKNPRSLLPYSLVSTLNQFVRESFVHGDVYDIYLYVALYAKLNFMLELYAADDFVRAAISYEDLKSRAAYHIAGSSSEDDAASFYSLTKKPMFNGKDANEFAVWVKSNLRYPEIARRNNTQGTVVVRFVINKDGSLSNVRVVRKADPALDQEALRIVRLSPKWTPGENEGKPVKVYYSFPIIFQL